MALEISVVCVVTGEVIFYVLHVVSKVSIVSDESISGIQNHRSSCDGIIFHVVLNISLVRVVSDKTIFYGVSKISIVSVVRNGIIFHVVLNSSVVSVNSDSL